MCQCWTLHFEKKDIFWCTDIVSQTIIQFSGLNYPSPPEMRRMWLTSAELQREAERQGWISWLQCPGQSPSSLSTTNYSPTKFT